MKFRNKATGIVYEPSNEWVASQYEGNDLYEKVVDAPAEEPKKKAEKAKKE